MNNSNAKSPLSTSVNSTEAKRFIEQRPSADSADSASRVPSTHSTSPETSVDPQTAALEQERLLVLGRMVSAVSHELNNRLNSVFGFLDLLAVKAKDPDTQRLAEKLQKYSRALGSLAESLRGYSEKIDGRAEHIDCGLVVKQAAELAGCLAKTVGVTIESDIAENVPAVKVQPASFRLGLMMCLDYFLRTWSRDRSEDKGVLRIEACCDEKQVGTICIVVDGQGLPQSTDDSNAAEVTSADGDEFPATLAAALKIMEAQGARTVFRADASDVRRIAVYVPTAEEETQAG